VSVRAKVAAEGGPEVWQGGGIAAKQPLEEQHLPDRDYREKRMNVRHWYMALLLIGSSLLGVAADAGAKPVAPGEHPRLFFRKDQLAEFRTRVETPEGQAIVANLRELLKKTVPIEQSQSGETRLAGLWAAGIATQYAVTGDPADAEAARVWVEQLVNLPVLNMPELRRGTRYMGIAIAYDLCYDAWPEAFRTQVATYLQARAEGLQTRKEGVKGDNPATQSNHNVEGRTQMGVIALAIVGDPGTTPAVEGIITAARRDLEGWSTLALGDHGWGTEGESFTINCLNWGVGQFTAAYQTMYGKPATRAPGLSWALALIMMRVVGSDMPYLGPEVSRWDGWPNTFGSSFYILGLATMPPEMRPAAKSFYEAHFGLASKAPFAIANPAEALYLLAYYPFALEAKPLGDVLPKALEDKRKGYYVFRNAYTDASDCLTTVYLRAEPLGKSWSCAPGVQVRGLGRRWAAFDPTHTATTTAVGARTEGAKATSLVAEADGSGVLTARGAQGAFALAVDYSGASGAPALLALSDQSGTALTMTLAGTVTVDGRTFRAVAEDGAALVGTLAAPAAGMLEKAATGVTLPAGAFVVLTMQTGAAPEATVVTAGDVVKVTVGRQTISLERDTLVLAPAAARQ
jgi:hypothetical protein